MHVSNGATHLEVFNTCRQSIRTKFLGPTDTRGSRIKATAQAGSVTIGWDRALNVDENHDAAALALAKKWGWLDRGAMLVGGGDASGSGNVYVVVEKGFNNQ